ncbi:MAG: helix-turn-helix domain-containing protein, partial [Candidatus Omnitrophica bacterium]|nr:helix-turn-helix domain-containing protein [Candidatus Omnitrophota bacterium]
MEDRFFSLNEVVAYLKIPKSTLYKLSQKGKIPSVKIGKQLRFRKSSIDAWLTDHETGERIIPISASEAKQVLVIDDDPLVLRSVTKFLKS